MTDGKKIFTCKNKIITIGDIFPHNITVPRDIEIVPKAHLGQGEELNRETFAALLLHAKREGDDYAETVNKQNDTLVFSGDKTIKHSKATERCSPSIWGQKMKVTHFEETAVEDVAVPMENPLLYGDRIADAPELFCSEEPYHGASYRNAVPVDYELNINVPKRVVEAEERFVGRHIRTSTTHPATARKTKLLGTVHSWSRKGRNLFKIVYRDGSLQEMDIEELHQYMVSSVKKGDHVDEDGRTAQEVYQILSFAAMLQEVELQREESHFFADGKSEGPCTCNSFKWCLASAGPIYDDQPQTTNQINAHMRLRALAVALHHTLRLVCPTVIK